MFNSVYARKVEFLLRLMPYVTNEGVFAVHGGTAINLFVKNMLRYSVDIDLTYIPLAGRENSLSDINTHLASIARKLRKASKVSMLYQTMLLASYYASIMEYR